MTLYIYIYIYIKKIHFCWRIPRGARGLGGPAATGSQALTAPGTSTGDRPQDKSVAPSG